MPRRFCASRSLFLSLMALAACGTSPQASKGAGGSANQAEDGQGGSSADQDGAASSTTIGPKGGVIETPEGVRLTIPEGALDEETTISITSSAAVHEAARGPAFFFEPEGLTFAKPVTVRVPYTPAELPEDTTEDVGLYVAPSQTSDFELLSDSTYSAEEGYVEATTSHFSTYVAAASTGSKFIQNQGYPTGIATDSEYVYWTNHGDVDHPATGDYGLVMKAPVAGGTVSVVADNQADPKGIAVNSSYIYWANGGANGKNAGIFRASKSGGAASLYATASFPMDVAIDSTNLYFTDAGSQSVSKVNLSTGAVTVLATGQDVPYAIAIDSTNVYWTTKNGNTIMKVAISGGTAVTLASSQSEPRDLAVDSSYVYWVNSGNGQVRRVSISGGTSSLLKTLKRPAGITIDSGYYYVTDWVYGYVLKYSTSTGSGTVRASSQSIPLAPLVSGGYVYWASNGGGNNSGWIGRTTQ